MPVSFYILFFSNALLGLLFFLGVDFLQENSVWIALGLIACIGIPHGAIDHVIFMKNTNRSPLFFYSWYLFLIAVSVFLWMFLPLLSLIVFLLISAYHFGQSQLDRYEIVAKSDRRKLNFFWGMFVLSAFILLNLSEIKLLITKYNEFSHFLGLFNYSLFLVLSIISFLLLVFYGAMYKKEVSLKREIMVLLLIMITFYIQPLLLGFALFFVLIHSIEVMSFEYDFLFKLYRNYNIKRFLKAVMPFTLISIIGTLFFYFLSEMSWIEASFPFLLLVVVSSLTLPHAFVMEIFYSKK